MTAPSFVDTNVLLYAGSKAPDAAILTAAKQMGCSTLYSEDLNAGQDYDGVRVINPFVSVAAS